MTRRLLRAAALAAIVTAVFTAAACGSDTRMERFWGDWERMQGAVADPDFALYIRGEGSNATVTFENKAVGTRARTAAILQGDVLSCTLPTGAGEGPDPDWPASSTPTSPAAQASDLSQAVPVQLSLNEEGDVLSVQMVAPGKQLVPLWEYRHPEGWGRN